ncbi:MULTISPECIES: HutD family protein [Ensifer]|uniref:HutD family protein n=1 Tax=Ensifer adhaerens TaxID=106592 RepID=A0ABY8HCF0_ENSAD|nr:MULTISPECIES: HutD family protein [Ensifer]ANK73697.1 HutD-family protein [Ensifer adhaerens]KDP70346.1 HutD-family protein [Ensifer adhaerens]KQX27071.1 HutD-family protein [Ensifer sp. Root423]KQZ58896.1 HutD-family protein [Ensifer sp. Root558]MBD9542124.1 HutD family protein [Ensifer sp. ENS04]
MKLLCAKDYKRMPWKNGGGETVEIAIFPEKASLADFDWRVSMATVATDGPFSSFPGIDRTLSILQGKGMRLMIEGRKPALLTGETAPLPFPADVATSATLVDGPIVDLNVMTRRGRLTHSVQRLALDHPHRAESLGGTTLVLCHGGAVRLTASDATAELAAGDTAVLTGAASLTIEPAASAVLFLITIDKPAA